MADWFYAMGSEPIGPYTAEQMKDLIRRGVINPDTLVWREGQSGWLPVRDAVGKPGGSAYASAAPPAAPAAPVMQSAPAAAAPTASPPFAPPAPTKPVKPPKKCDICHKKIPPGDLSREWAARGSERNPDGEAHGLWICAPCRMEAYRQQFGGYIPRYKVEQYDAAGFWIRLVARLIDGLILVFFQGIIVVFLGLKNPLIGMKMNSDPAAVINAYAALMQSSMMMVQFAIGLLYEVLFLGLLGATPGKLMIGLKVISSEGEPIGVFRAFFRYFAFNLCGLCGIGYLMAAFTENKRALHDMICGTRVVHR